MNVSDPYSHENFNPSLDKQTGFKTKSILCAPIRSRSGDGVVAVIQMLNKIGDGGVFTIFDEEVRSGRKADKARAPVGTSSTMY